MFVDYVLPAIIILGLLLGFYFLTKDSVDVTGSDGVPDKPTPPKDDVVNPPKKPTPHPTQPVEKMTKKQLIAEAKRRKIKINPRMRKEQILKKLK